MFDAVTAAGVYFSRFYPDAPWKLLDTEFVAENCRFDIVYVDPTGMVLIDELKFGRNRSAEYLVRDQLNRYLDEGKRRWGDCFGGLRLCAVNEPARSRFFPPDGQRSQLLSDSLLAMELPLR